MDKYPSALLEKAVSEFAKLPGVGRKTALRLVLFMLKRSENEVDAFSEAILRAKQDIKYCKVCHNISDTDVCPICGDKRRDGSVVCVVDRKSTRLNSSHANTSYAVFCLKKKKPSNAPA